MERFDQDFAPPHDSDVDLDAFDPRPPDGIKKADCEAEIGELRQRINDLQDLLYANRGFAVLIVLQGMDTSGKDGTIKSVFRDVGPLGTTVHPFGVPSEEELAHDFLWRYHRRTPARGQLAIFNRSHYESVLVERVKAIVPRKVWKRRYDQINDFEKMLASEKTVILKFFLNISKDEQRKRLQARIDDPKKRWKFSAGDLDDRKLWGDYRQAYADAIGRCHIPDSPWYVVPADKKWYRDVVVARIVADRLGALDLSYPPASEALEGVVVV
ncbi:MAG: polyphosphate kinase 2 family protein [Dehalococcoidia bacterium]|nr:polyphosphate kinase 2 family protein [Dehalococcoidia bacterium]